MQVKTIKRNIEQKMLEWLSSISDQQLRLDVKKNLLVSGGSIVSLFLNEKVNDYDVYLKDREVLLRLVNYYTKNRLILVLNGLDKDSLVEELEEQYENFLKSISKDADINDINNQYAISIRNLKEDQVKMFMYGAGHKVDYKNKKTEDLFYDPVFFSPNAVSLSNDIQIVCRFHGDNEQIHKTFDFVHATNYFTFEDGLVTNKLALESILTKQLKYQGSLYPLTSIIRMKKFLQRNWKINAGEILKILFQVSEFNLKNPDVLEDQLIGIDVAYFGKLIEVLRNVDPEKIDSSYINEIIDRVFNQTEEDE